MTTGLADFRKAVLSSSIVSNTDARGIITDVNENFELISGYSKDELCGRTHSIINSGYHPRAFWVDMWKMISSGKIWRSEVKNRRKNGSYYWVDTFIIPFKDPDGQVVEYLSIRNDITLRKSQEEEIIMLNHSLIDFQNAISGSSIVSRADLKGMIIYVNKNFVNISGYSEQELLGENHKMINSGYHPKSFWTSMWKTIASGKTWRAEVKNQAKNGTFYWVDTFIYPLKDNDNRIVEYLSIRNDITQRKLQEQQLVDKEQELRLLTDQLNLAISASGMGLWKVDYESKMLVGDARVRSIFGIDKSHISFHELSDVVHPEDLDAKLALDRSLIEGDDNDYVSEFRVISPSTRETKYLRSSGIFIRDTNGKRIGGISVVHDLTYDRRREDNLLRALKEKEALVREIHHRVKNNLQLISSLIYLRQLSSKQMIDKGFMDAIRDKIKSVSLIHERLLQTDGLNSISIKDYLERLIHDISLSYQAPNTTVRLHCDIIDHQFTTDYATYLGQLVNELVTNAYKYAFVGRELGTIRVILRRTNSFVLTVEDDGVGFQSKSDPLTSSSYGMQLIQVFTKQIKGSLTLEHQEGTRFSIIF